MLFDTGSQEWCISDEMRNYLKLSLLRKECIFLKTFCNVEPTLSTVDIVQLEVKAQVNLL